MKALDGITVIDLTDSVAGPYCTMMMGDLGAKVIKVEQAGEGDIIRRSTPIIHGVAPVFTAYNRNKKSIALDLNRAEGVALVKKMLAKADILVDSYPPGTMEKLGLDFVSLKDAFPKLICASLTGFGSSGPYADRPVYEGTIQAETGMTQSLINDSHGTPYMVGGNLAQTSSSYFFLAAILGALHQRRRSGCGQKVETSIYKSMLAMFSLPINDYLFNGVECPVDGNAPEGFIRSKDGWLRISFGDQPMWERAIKLIDDPVLHDPRYATAEVRNQNRELLLERVEQWTQQRTSAQAIEEFTQAGLPGGIVRTIADLRRDPHMLARNHIVEIEVEGNGKLPFFASPFRMRESPIEYHPAPGLGENGEEILSDLLEMRPEEITELKQSVVLA